MGGIDNTEMETTMLLLLLLLLFFLPLHRVRFILSCNSRVIPNSYFLSRYHASRRREWQAVILFVQTPLDMRKTITSNEFKTKSHPTITGRFNRMRKILSLPLSFPLPEQSITKKVTRLPARPKPPLPTLGYPASPPPAPLHPSLLPSVA